MLPTSGIYSCRLIVGIDVHIPGPDHQVYVPINVNVTCDNWYTGSGTLTAAGQTGALSFEGGSWSNYAPVLADVSNGINTLIRDKVKFSTALSLPLSSVKCNGLGVTPPSPDPLTAEILFTKPPRHTPPGGATLIAPTLKVTFTSLKRLVARDSFGNVLYSPTENIVLQAYADFTSRATPVLTMQENQQVALNLPPIMFNSPLLDPLVVLANVDQQAQGGKQDSAYAVWPQALNFSPGAHTLTVTKTYSLAAGSVGGGNKPSFVSVPGYELSYTVDYKGPLVAKPETNPGRPRPVTNAGVADPRPAK